MNLKPPPETDDIKVLKLWCDEVYEFLKHPVFHTIEIGTIGSGTYFKTDINGLTTYYGNLSGLPRACMYGTDLSDSVALAAQDTWYQITSFTTDAYEQDADADYTESHIVIGTSGNYHVDYNVSCHSALSNDYGFQIRKNNGATGFDLTNAFLTTSVPSQIDTYSGGAIMDLDSNDTLELWVKRTDGAAVSKTIVIDHVLLRLIMVGGT